MMLMAIDSWQGWTVYACMMRAGTNAHARCAQKGISYHIIVGPKAVSQVDVDLVASVDAHRGARELAIVLSRVEGHDALVACGMHVQV